MTGVGIELSQTLSGQLKKKSKLSGPNCLGSGEEVDGELGNLRAECWFSLYKLNLES